MSTHLLTFRKTSIVIGSGLSSSNLLDEACLTKTVVLIADSHVGQLYGEKIRRRLQASSKEVYMITFPPGEQSKTREVKSNLEDEMQKKGLGRETTLIALGGGVTTDLAGFIASTYCRGIPFISMPTTVLAMVDAAIGGKTGVNTPYGKNLIGSFYLPKTLILDLDFIQTLSEKEIKEGLVEVIKKALVRDERLFGFIESHLENILQRGEALEQVIKEACQIKLEVVEEDFEEKKGLRRILNFGHTVGHALERYFDYKLRHGEAVALGILAESYIASELGLLKRSFFNRILKLLSSFIEVRSFDEEKVYESMSYDKKSQDQLPRFVLIDSIGHVVRFNEEYCSIVDKEHVLNALKFIQKL